MKVTLRNRRTGEFLTAQGQWVASGLQAHDFGHTNFAREVCARLGLPDVDVFYIFDDPNRNYWIKENVA